ncbi:unnamed protein product [Prorocentrum cordatum]|uniref:Uncharacterized protein n=1 Tax=Prorocentrum cordatum TaxID=2364126 RepID=A0ABN9V309_9DINO|nr:unnamed protein product [Polarella glacialis]
MRHRCHAVFSSSTACLGAPTSGAWHARYGEIWGSEADATTLLTNAVLTSHGRLLLICSCIAKALGEALNETAERLHRSNMPEQMKSKGAMSVVLITGIESPLTRPAS